MELPPPTYGSSPALLLQGAASSPADVVDGAGVTNSVTVHPLVLLSVLDHHTRRQEGAGRVIGTLLGRRDGDKVEITNCFAVPHAERGDEVAIGKDFNRQMLALHLRANKRESVVGWYATALPEEDEGNEEETKDGGKGKKKMTSSPKSYRCIADTSSLIHEFYAGECDDDPIHLVIDTSLIDDSLALRAYRSTPVQVKGEPLANMFHEIRLGMTCSGTEKICVDKMIKSDDLLKRRNKSQEDEVPEDAASDESPVAALQISMEKLYSMLETATSYVDSVVDGSVPPNDVVGRQIADALSTIPRIRPEVFDRMFNDELQDLLMVTYLSKLTRTQLEIAEKLNATLSV